MSVTVRLNKRRLDELRLVAPARVKAILFEQVEGGAQLARSLAPVRTGKLRSGIEVEQSVDGSTATARLFSRAPYSVYVEFGTARAAAQPFFMPSVESIRRGLVSALRKAI